MPKFVTPARLATAFGVLTGLSAAVTSLVGAVPSESAAGKAVVGAAGVLGTCLTLVKFLEGQAKWEATPIGQVQALGALSESHQLEAESAPVDVGIDSSYAPVAAGAPDRP